MGIIDKISKNLDKGVKFSEVDAFSDVDTWISTGSPSLDYNLRTHGYPTGIIECRGASQSGKTTFSLHAMKEAVEQYKDKAVVVILSSERRDNRELAQMIGVPIEKILVINTATIESVFNEFGRIVEAVKEEVGEEDLRKYRFLFIWDSLGNTVSSQEKEALKTRREGKKKGDESKHAAMGSAARAISLGFRGAISMGDEINYTLFVINRGYAKMSGYGGTTSYGGTSVEYYPCLRLDLSRKEGVKIGDDEMGQITRVKTIKTDFDRPKQEFEVEIGYGYGIVLSQNDIDLGIEMGILEKHGRSGAKFNDKLKWTSRRQLYAHYEEKNPMLKVLMSKLKKAVHKRVTKERKERLEK